MQRVELQWVFDLVIGNLDRHGSNTALIKTKNGLRLAPIFDNSKTAFASYNPFSNDIVKNIGYHELCNIYPGDLYWDSNIKKIKNKISLRKPDYKGLFHNLGLSESFKKSLYQIYMERIAYCEKLSDGLISFK